MAAKLEQLTQIQIGAQLLRAGHHPTEREVRLVQRYLRSSRTCTGYDRLGPWVKTFVNVFERT